MKETINSFIELGDKVVEQKEEIERLKSVYKKNLKLVDEMYIKDKEIERLNNIINELEELCENQFIDYRVDYLGNKRKNYAAIDTNKIMEIINGEF